MEIIVYILVAFCTFVSRTNTFNVHNKHTRFSRIDRTKAFSIPRCGVQDALISQEVNEYRLKGSKWKTNRLTFAIENYPDSLAKNDVINEISRAFNIWSKYTNLKFIRTNSLRKANFKIKFVNGSHGDGIPFDGPENVLGHAFSPNTTKSGQIHFDASEWWTIKSHKGINLYQNAAHEIGHALGLDHSTFNSSVMSAYYPGYNAMFENELSQDDIEAIQAVYGKKGIRKNVKSENLRNYTKKLKQAISRKRYKKYLFKF